MLNRARQYLSKEDSACRDLPVSSPSEPLSTEFSTLVPLQGGFSLSRSPRTELRPVPKHTRLSVNLTSAYSAYPPTLI